MAKIITYGEYQLSFDWMQQEWAYGGGTATGDIGHGPLRLIGLFDTQPDQGFPETGFDYSQWVIPLPSGKGRVRFTSQTDYNVSGLYSDVLYGTRTNRAMFTGCDGTDYASYAVGSWITAFDSPFDLDNFDPNGAWLWSNLAQTGQQWRSMSIGPELLTGFAQNTSQTWDINQLGGGARFVGIWISSFWVGADPGRTDDPWIQIKYVVEDAEGPPASQPVTYAFPVQKVADQAGSLQELTPANIVAQVNLMRYGAIPMTYTTQGSFRCQICNGGGVALDAQIVPYVGTMYDVGITRADVTVGASSATSIGRASVEESEMQGPYSYANVYLQNDSAEGFEGGPAIVWVVVG